MHKTFYLFSSFPQSQRLATTIFITVGTSIEVRNVKFGVLFTILTTLHRRI